MADKDIVINITTTADTAEVEDLSSKVDDLQTSADNASDAMDNLGSSTEQITDESIQKATDDTEQLGEEASKTSEEFEKMQGSLDLLETSALFDIANQVGTLGANAEGMAQDMNTAAISVGQLSTNVGMAEPQMVSMINHISNATFPQNEAMAYANALNQMGVSADQLGDSATNMDRINDATRTLDYTGVMQLTQGLRSVGVEANNLPSAFNAIAFAEANVNGGAGTLNQVLKRQAATINEYGLNVDQLVVMMQALSEKGVQGMKMGSELSKVLKDNNGDLRAVEESLGLAAGSLSNASEATGQYSGKLQELANEEAEHKTWLDQLGAAWEDISLAMSPVLEPLASFMGLIGQAGSYAVGINGLITLGKTIRDAEIAQWALNFAMSMNPIMIVVIAIIALIAILGYLYFTNEDVRNAINGLGQAFIQIGQIIYTAFVNAIQWIIGALQNLWNYIVTLGGLLPQNVSITGNQIIDTVLRVLAFIATLPIQLQIILLNMIAKVLGFGDNFVQNMISAATGAVNGFVSYISQLPGKLAEELNEMLAMAQQFIMDIANMLTGGAAGMVVGWITGSGESSPGYMYDAFKGELDAMEYESREFRSVLPANMGNTASNMVSNYNNNFTGLTGGSSGKSSGGSGSGVVINIYGDVDSEAKMQKFAEYIRRELFWNNETAGRNVEL